MAVMQQSAAQHISMSELSDDIAIGSRRWVIDSGSCVDIVGEGSVTKKEKNSVDARAHP